MSSDEYLAFLEAINDIYGESSTSPRKIPGCKEPFELLT